jgi:hypothetical protein
LSKQERGFAIRLDGVPAGLASESSISVGLVPIIIGADTIEMDGLEWRPMDQNITVHDPLFYRTLTCPTDDWVIYVYPLPRITLKFEKLSLDDEQGTFIDAIDWAMEESLEPVDIQTQTPKTALRRSRHQRKSSRRFQ